MQPLKHDSYARAVQRADRAVVAFARRVGRRPYELTGGRTDPASILITLLDLQTHVDTRVEVRARFSADEMAELITAHADLAALELVRQQQGLQALGSTLAACRRAPDVASLADEVPAHATRLGFRRALFSWVRDGRWVPRSALIEGDPARGAPYLDGGTTPPAEVRSFIEERVVRTGTAILVADAATNPGVHRRLHRINAAESYVAAPVVIGGAVRGLLHVADHAVTGTVDAHDVPLVAALAHGVGTAIELVALREHARGSHDEDDLAARLGGSSRMPADISSLSSREREVLALLAEGLTNPQIAERLFISSETVKTHVRKVLQKLGADTRTHAATIYQLASRRDSLVVDAAE